MSEKQPLLRVQELSVTFQTDAGVVQAVDGLLYTSDAADD